MAIRSSAGTGVTISLVVFVLLTVLLLAGSILLWGKLQAAQEEAAKADENLMPRGSNDLKHHMAATRLWVI